MSEDDKRPVFICLDPPTTSKSRVRAASVTMLRQSRRLLWRSRNLILSALAIFSLCWMWISSPSGGRVNVLSWSDDLSGDSLGIDYSGGLLRPTKGTPKSSDYDDVLARWQFAQEWNETGSLPGAGAVYGNTLSNLTDKDEVLPETESRLTPANNESPAFETDEKPYYFNPYPNYDSVDWKRAHRANFVPCDGPAGREHKDVQVFKGRPENFPNPSFGSYDLFGIDPNVCYERDARLGQYGLSDPSTDEGTRLDWTKVDWGKLQDECAERNKARFEKPIKSADGDRYQAAMSASGGGIDDELRKERQASHRKRALPQAQSSGSASYGLPKIRPQNPAEHRTAVLLRSYTGRQYSENEKQVIRAMITELSLRTGGQYQVYLLIQVRDDLADLALWDKPTYDYVLQTQVPTEFHDIAILWGSYQVEEMYPHLDKGEAALVHNAQWLCVQKFMLEHTEYDYVWNWEMDSRVLGHHYDMLTKFEEFAKKQPRKGMWERNERYYIPELHGDYDTTFRTMVEKVSGKKSIWGPIDLPFIQPVGPKPPVSNPSKDNYQWGVGEEADLITLSPMFDPVNSNWVLRDQVWNYNDSSHNSTTLPRRTTIVTQSRLSRRLVETMHAENVKGNHVGSEMAANTVALLHGLKAIYAPMPVFMDRPFPVQSLQKWFNPGPGGVAGGPGSAAGWGFEHRFQGATWYYRAVPPQRMYNNWLGFADTGIGGAPWEKDHGRPCLQAILLHPIKNVQATWPGYASTSDLPYNWSDDLRSDKEKLLDPVNPISKLGPLEGLGL